MRACCRIAACTWHWRRRSRRRRRGGGCLVSLAPPLSRRCRRAQRGRQAGLAAAAWGGRGMARPRASSAQISAFVDFCSLSVHSQRQRPCLENASQCCCACGLSRGASSIGELRRRAGRSMHSSPASGRKRVFRPPFHRVCPSGQVQLWHLVKVVRVVCGKKTKAEAWPQELKVNIPSGYDNVNLIWSSRG